VASGQVDLDPILGARRTMPPFGLLDDLDRQEGP
jgi:hypothetical protein